jgi:hypothetical protein
MSFLLRERERESDWSEAHMSYKSSIESDWSEAHMSYKSSIESDWSEAHMSYKSSIYLPTALLAP